MGALAELQRAGKIRHLGVSNVTVAQIDQAAPHRAHRLWYPLGGSRGIRTSRIKEIAARHHVSTIRVALAWLLARSPVMLPIPGTESVEHLEDNVRAAALKLAPADLKDLA